MKHWTSVVFVALASYSAVGQDSGKHGKCWQEAMTQSEMHACANQEAAQAEAELSATYREALSSARSRDGAVQKVEAAERAWVAFRDAYMEAMYPAKDKQAEYGSIFPMEYALRRVKLTRQHVGALKDLIEEYDGGEGKPR